MPVLALTMPAFSFKHLKAWDNVTRTDSTLNRSPTMHGAFCKREESISRIYKKIKLQTYTVQGDPAVSFVWGFWGGMQVWRGAHNQNTHSLWAQIRSEAHGGCPSDQALTL